MKTKILLLILIGLIHIGVNIISKPINSVVSTNLTINTVNGSDESFVAQQSYNSGQKYLNFFFFGAEILAVAWILFPKNKNQVK